jgi:hypothetical protein
MTKFHDGGEWQQRAISGLMQRSKRHLYRRHCLYERFYAANNDGANTSNGLVDFRRGID